MYFNYDKHQKNHLAFTAGKLAVKGLLPLTYDFKCIGKDNIPKNEGKIIVACNHISFADPAVIAANLPWPVHYMAKSELFSKRACSFALSNMNAFPVVRNTSDRKAIRFAKNLLDSGKAVGIFPEGKRVKELIPVEAKMGVALLSKLTKADVLPCCLYRKPENQKFRHDLILRFGPVLSYEDLFPGEERGKKAELKFAADIIMKEITSLWEDEHWKLH